MRICLATTTYPPENTGGIPRQRQILAAALAKQGHEVHVITQGKRQDTRVQDCVTIHTVPYVQNAFPFSDKYPALNYRLTHSLAIQEQIRVLNKDVGLDVLDVPLWGLEGFVPIYANEMPVVLWLQTSFAQLIAKGQQLPRPDDMGVIGLEKECLRSARGIIADSHTVLTDFEKLYNLDNLRERSRVVHLGLPDIPEDQREVRRERDTIEALLVGRLEKRKGTSFIFEILPELLRTEKNLRVRFIGADNSPWDGFFHEHGQTYPEYFHTHWPGLRGRVIFEGPVSERRLVEAYNQADLMLVPSLYESFGLIYLEAMRASLPIVTFSLGAATEIFPQGETDGAVLVSPENRDHFSAAVLNLVQDAQRRKAIGDGGRERFVWSFLDTRMAEESAAYYQEIVGKSPLHTALRPRRVYQVMEALDIGDAVSTIALNNAKLLRQLHAGGTILSQHEHPELSGKSRPVDQFNIESNSALIFHYWNYSYLEDFIRSFPGPKAIHFHNITPPEFFSPGSPGYEATTRGYAQLPGLLHLFDLLIGDSSYNLEVLKPFLKEPKPGIVIPPVVEAEEVRARPFDTQLLEQLKKQKGIKLLFVGRLARNKRQDRLVELLAALSQSGGDKPWLYLVGGDQGDPSYRAEIEALRSQMPDKNRLVITGKVSELVLYSYYRAADVFVSASEHEGFGVPLIEAMALDIPVLAYEAGAVPETMGGSGVLLHKWDTKVAAEQMLRLIVDPTLRTRLLEGQRANLRRFTCSAVQERLSTVVRYLQEGKKDEQWITSVV